VNSFNLSKIHAIEVITADTCFMIINDKTKNKSFYEELNQAQKEGAFKFKCDIQFKNKHFLRRGCIIKKLCYENIPALRYWVDNSGKYSCLNEIHSVSFHKEDGSIFMILNKD
jgi:hypothetical protein